MFRVGRVRSSLCCARPYSQASSSKVTLEAVRSPESSRSSSEPLDVDDDVTSEERTFYRVAHAAALGKPALKQQAPVRTRYESERWRFAKTRGSTKFDVRIDEKVVKGRQIPSFLATRSTKREFSSSATSSAVPKYAAAPEAATVEEDDSHFDDDDDLDPLSVQARSGVIRPGDLLEYRFRGLARYGIVTRTLPVAPPAYEVICLEGYTDAFKDNQVLHVMPDAVDPKLARQCGELNKLAQEREGSGEEGRGPTFELIHTIVQQLRVLILKLDDRIKALSKAGASELYARLIAQGKKTSITTASALRMIKPDGPRDGLDLLAMHTLMSDDSLYFQLDPINHKTSNRFTLRPPSDLETFETVRHWLREDAPEMRRFVKRANDVIQWGRAHPASPVLKLETGKSLPSLNVPPSLRWTGSDLVIIKFLRETAIQHRLTQPSPHLSIAPIILKRVEQIGGLQLTSPETSLEDGRHALLIFLGEIGATAPWEDWPLHELGDTVHKWDQTTRPRHLFKPVKDAHDSVRKDFTSLPVYTIDDAGASELDDGLSIEQGPDSTWWVHVHVADPTALFQPNHWVARLARDLVQTEYLPERTFPMLPESIIREHGLSLGSSAGTQRVLTFSIRVDEQGNIVDSEVNAGAVENVKRLTYSAVDDLLGYKPPPPRQQLSLGRLDQSVLDTRPETRHLDDEWLKTDERAKTDLVQLHNLAKALLRKRVETSAIAWMFPTGSVSVVPKLGHHFVTRSTPSLYESTPFLTFDLPRPDDNPFMSPAQVLVSELMVAGNRAAARFAKERDIPFAYRSQGSPISPPETVEKALALRDPETGVVDAFELLRYGLDFSPGRDSLVPGQHWPMGINDEFGYGRATSPLRRYSDMFCHWQLKSQLLPGAKKPLWSRSQAADEIQYVAGALANRGKLGKASEDFWRTYFISHKFRAVQDHQAGRTVDRDLHPDIELVADLFNDLTAVALKPSLLNLGAGSRIQRIFIKELGVRAELRFDDERLELENGGQAKVRIDKVLLSGRSRIICSLR